MHDPLVWIDCEMTGLSLVDDALIEVAVIVTDYQLQPLDKGIDLLIKPSSQALEQMNDFVRNMHTHSGLLEQLAGPDAMDMQAATAEVLAYIKRLVPQERGALLAGNSVGNDKNFLARDMPEVIEHLHYRIIDVSTIKELAKHWYPQAYAHAPEKTGNHRALGDIADSIDELRYYRQALFEGEGERFEGEGERDYGAIAAQISADSTLARIAERF